MLIYLATLQVGHPTFGHASSLSSLDRPPQGALPSWHWLSRSPNAWLPRSLWGVNDHVMVQLPNPQGSMENVDSHLVVLWLDLANIVPPSPLCYFTMLRWVKCFFADFEVTNWSARSKKLFIELVLWF